MKVKFNEFLAAIYASLFEFSLKPSEAVLWSIGSETKLVAPMLFPERLQNLRKVRHQRSFFKRQLAERVVAKISKIPTVEAVFLTGSVAVWNAVSRADIDLMIITAPNTLWITRMLVVGLLKIIGRYRSGTKITDRVCTNIYLDTRNLKIRDRNLYTAHEVLQAECFFDRGGVERKWLTTNSWTAHFLPVVYREKQRRVHQIGNFSEKKGQDLANFFLLPLEWLAFIGQTIYMKPKMTREEIGWGKAIFHPNDLTAKVFKRWQKKLQWFGYNRSQAKAFFFGS